MRSIVSHGMDWQWNVLLSELRIRFWKTDAYAVRMRQGHPGKVTAQSNQSASIAAR